MRNDDDPTPSDTPGALPSFATVPPPAGVVDEHSAPTTVAELPDSFLAELKAATKQHAASRAKGRELQATQKNQSFELELREQLTAKLVDVRVEPPAAPAAPVELEPASTRSDELEPSPAAEAVAAPATPEVRDALDVPSSPPRRAAVPADGVSVFSMVVLALVAIAAIVWTFMNTLR